MKKRIDKYSIESYLMIIPAILIGILLFWAIFQSTMSSSIRVIDKQLYNSKYTSGKYAIVSKSFDSHLFKNGVYIAELNNVQGIDVKGFRHIEVWIATHRIADELREKMYSDMIN